MVVTKNKTDLYIASQINHEGLFEFLASEFLSELYLYAYDSVKDAKHSIQKYLDWYNQERPHSNLNRLTPDEAYYGLLSPLKKAA